MKDDPIAAAIAEVQILDSIPETEVTEEANELGDAIVLGRSKYCVSALPIDSENLEFESANAF